MSVQEFGVKGYLKVILGNCLNMLTLLCSHYLIGFDEIPRPYRFLFQGVQEFLFGDDLWVSAWYKIFKMHKLGSNQTLKKSQQHSKLIKLTFKVIQGQRSKLSKCYDLAKTYRNDHDIVSQIEFTFKVFQGQRST